MKLYTVAEVAERVGLSEKSVRGAIARGDLAASKVSGRIRVPKKAVKAWLAANPAARGHTSGGSPLADAATLRSRQRTGAFARALERTEL